MTARRSGGRPPSRGAAGGVRRADRVAAEIQRILSELLLYKVRDPRVAEVNITRVHVNDDLRLAKISFTLLAMDEGSRLEAQRGLESASPFFRRVVAGELGLRHAPELLFAFDKELESARRVDALLRDIQREREEREQAERAAAGEDVPERDDDGDDDNDHESDDGDAEHDDDTDPER
ncbi:MAG TPA: 30S ribosome-binding factor RbfA [Candidatus Binatia bacterium]